LLLDVREIEKKKCIFSFLFHEHRVTRDLSKIKDVS